MGGTSWGIATLIIAGITNASLTMPMKYARKWAWENTWLVWTRLRARGSASRGRPCDHSQPVDGLPFSDTEHHSRSLWIRSGLGSCAGLFRCCGGDDRDYSRVFHCIGNICGRRQPNPDGVTAPRIPQQRSWVCGVGLNCSCLVGCDALCRRRKVASITKRAV